MKKLIGICLFITILYTSHAQEYKFVPKNNRVAFKNIKSLNIQGHDSDEVVILIDDYTNNEDRKKGLKIIGANGLSDNSSIGLHVDNKGLGAIITQIVNSGFCGSSNEYTVKVPSNCNIVIDQNAWEGDDLEIQNITGELEISTNYNNIHLINVTGPMAVKSVYGSIDAEFTELSSQGSISLYSVYEHIDITIPQNSKAHFNLKTQFGNIYSDLDFDVDKEKSKNSGWTGSKIIGSINGGGSDIILNASYSNIFLRGQ